MQNIFGSGILWGRQLTDATGAAVSNPTPVKFGVLQEVSLDVSWDTKTLHGQNQFPVAVGRGKGKISGKAKAAQITGRLMNAIVFGQTLTAGAQIIDYNDTSTGTAIPSTPYEITIAPASSGTFTKDLGVRIASSGLRMVRVASAPATGQYAVNETTGVYTFAAADTTVKVLIDYQYTASISGANKSTISSLPMGYAPTFSIDLYAPFNGKHMIITLHSCIASKMAMATKLDDFVVPEFDFEAFSNSADEIMTYSLSE